MGRSNGVDSWCAFGGRRPARRSRCVAPAEGSAEPNVPPAPGGLDPTLLVYVLDIFDPWSYAYLPSVEGVLTEASRLVGVELVNDNRYAGCSAAELGARAAAVTATTGTVFGAGFHQLLTDEDLVLDVSAAAAGLIGLMAAGDVPVARVLREVQHEFFVRGRPLGSPGVLHDVGTRLGLDGPAIEVFANSDRGREMAAEDFDIAAEFALDGSPLLMASHAGRFFEFDGLGASAQRLVDQFNSVLARP